MTEGQVCVCVCVYVCLTVISLCDLPAGITRQIFLPLCVCVCVCVCAFLLGRYVFALRLLTRLYVQYTAAISIQ